MYGCVSNEEINHLQSSLGKCQFGDLRDCALCFATLACVMSPRLKGDEVSEGCRGEEKKSPLQRFHLFWSWQG